MKRIISKILSLSLIVSVCSVVPSYSANLYGWLIPMTYDMSSKVYPSAYMANLNEGAYGYFEDPTNSANTVLGIKTIQRDDGIYSGTDLRSVVQNTDVAIEFTFDIYREDCTGYFQFEIKPTDSTSYGVAPQKSFRFTNNQQFSVEPPTAVPCSVLNNKWYTFKFQLDKSRKNVSVYYKLRENSKFTFVQDVDFSLLDFEGHAIMFYMKNNSRTGFTYLDNMSWVGIDDVSFDLDSNEFDVSINPTVQANFNLNVDVDKSSLDASFIDEVGNTIPAKVILNSNGAQITPTSQLLTDMYYNLVVNASLVDVSGEVLVNTYEIPFTTQQPLSVDAVTLNSGANLNLAVAGNNTFNYTITSVDGLSHPYVALMIAYDKDTGERLAIASKGGTVSATTPTKSYLSLSLSGMSNFKLECYIWSGVLTMKPMTKVYVY